MEKGTQIVTIKSFSPMFKGEEEASNIHIINVEEHDFNIVGQKTLYNIGDKVLFITPDYCLSNIELFKPYTEPDGNSKKSRLGKNNRVKAIKFGFTDKKGNKVFSNGILVPINEITDYFNTTEHIYTENKELKKYKFDDVLNLYIHNSFCLDFDIDSKLDYSKLLEITKYIEPEDKLQGNAKGTLPNGMSKTDEINFNLNSRNLEELLPCEMIGSIKVDGSSCTIYFKDEDNFGICSRSQEKYLTEKSYGSFYKYYDKELKKKGWSNNQIFVEDIETYFKNNNLEITQTVSNDDWVILGMPILEKLKKYSRPLAVRAEIYGNSLKGSGNKHNPHSKLPKSIAVYGIDDYSKGVTDALPMKEVIEICKELELPIVDIVFQQTFNTIEEIKDACENYFKDNLVEGIVVRTYNTADYTGKYMCNTYDSLK
jgi:hypothetical protein